MSFRQTISSFFSDNVDDIGPKEAKILNLLPVKGEDHPISASKIKKRVEKNTNLAGNTGYNIMHDMIPKYVEKVKNQNLDENRYAYWAKPAEQVYEVDRYVSIFISMIFMTVSIISTISCAYLELMSGFWISLLFVCVSLLSIFISID